MTLSLLPFLLIGVEEVEVEGRRGGHRSALLSKYKVSGWRKDVRMGGISICMSS